MHAPQTLTIASAETLPTPALHAFYQKMHPHLGVKDYARLAWLYRDVAPVVALDGDTIVAHAARIPFTLNVGEQPKRCAWFVDFAVLPAYQGQGLGQRLTQRWMDYADTLVSFCNEKSMGVFRKFGWQESFRPHLHFLPLAPFNHRRFRRFIPKPLRDFLNLMPKWYFQRGYHQIAGASDLFLTPVQENALVEFLKTYHPPANAIIPLRDAPYFTWRLLNSPHREHYNIVHLADDPSVQAILKLNRQSPSPYVDILMLSNPLALLANTRLLAHIASWAGQQNFSYVRLLTCDANFSKHLKTTLRAFGTLHRFTFFAADPATQAQFQNHPWHFELIDSDWEQFT